MLAFFVKNKKLYQSTDRRRSETRRSLETFDNNSNENKNKSRRDDDITMVGTYNNRVPSKLTGWFHRGDVVLIGNQKIMFEL